MPTSSVGGSSFLSGPPREKKETKKTKVTKIADTSRSGGQTPSTPAGGSTTTTTTTTRTVFQETSKGLDRSQSGSVQRKKKDDDAPTIPGQRRSLTSKGALIEGDEVAVGSEYAAIHRQIFAVQSMLKTREDMLDIQEGRIRGDEPEVVLSRESQGWINRPSVSPTRIREGGEYASSRRGSQRTSSTLGDVNSSPQRPGSVRPVEEHAVHINNTSYMNSMMPSVIPPERDYDPGPHPCVPDGPTRHDLRNVPHPHLQARVESLENEVARLRDENNRLLNSTLPNASAINHREVNNASLPAPLHNLVDRAVSASDTISHLSARRSDILGGVSPAPMSSRHRESFEPPVSAPTYGSAGLGRDLPPPVSMSGKDPFTEHTGAMVPAPYHQAPPLPTPTFLDDTHTHHSHFTRPPGDPGRRSPPPPSTAQPPSMSYVEDVITKHEALRSGRISPFPTSAPPPLPPPPPPPPSHNFPPPVTTFNGFSTLPPRNSPLPRSESFHSHATQIPESRGPRVSPTRHRSFTPPAARGASAQGYRLPVPIPNHLAAGSIGRSSVRSLSSRGVSKSIDDFKSEFTRITGKMSCASSVIG